MFLSAVSRRRRGMADHNRPGQVLIIVENNPVGLDNRVSKQIRSLIQHGFSVWVITRRHVSNAPYRSMPAVRLLEYRPPAEPAGPLGYIAEYAYCFMMATALSVRLLLA